MHKIILFIKILFIRTSLFLFYSFIHFISFIIRFFFSFLYSQQFCHSLIMFYIGSLSFLHTVLLFLPSPHIQHLISAFTSYFYFLFISLIRISFFFSLSSLFSTMYISFMLLTFSLSLRKCIYYSILSPLSLCFNNH